MANANIVMTFEHSVLAVKFLENANISLQDIKDIYAYGDQWANGKPYCVMFEADHHYELSEDAIDYMSTDNPSDDHILAKAYVISTKESYLKTKAHLIFDHPILKPKIFSTAAEARKWLDSVVKEHHQK